MSTKDRLKKFENKQPEIVFEWKDAESGAEGWTVINSLRGGAAGGGTRMRKGLDRNEVLSLAKTMEVKFAVSGPEIGGAKSGINFDPADPRKEEVLKRWYKAVMPLLKTYYGTGGDLNVDEIKEVIPITESYGLQHPQEGVLVGHFNPGPEEKKQKIKQLNEGVLLAVKDAKYSPDPKEDYVVADLITGWGVSEAVRHYYNLWGGNIQGKRAVIQGWGNVAAAAAYYLVQAGAKVVGIIDRNGGIIAENGLGLEEVRQLYVKKTNNTLTAENMLSYEETNARIWDLKAEIFVPGAASRLVTKEQLERMKAAGMEVISCGANVPFKDPDIFFGPTGEYADEQLSVIPDFIANCGMARTFAYLMQSNIDLSDKGIFEDASQTILKALTDVQRIHPQKTRIMEASFGLVMDKIMPEQF
jgi:glutamate dehydrogenase/leucine dehydrogenase